MRPLPTEVMGSSYIVVFITTATSKEALSLARTLLEQRKVACVNVVSNVSSLFWWQGKLDSAQENLLVLKTKAAKLDELIKLVKEIHSYSVPEIIALPIIGGNPDYLAWLDREVG